MLTLKLFSQEDTIRLAHFLYENLEEKHIIYLNGPMGSGKTYLTKAFFEAMGGDSSEVCSPTYTYLMIHHAPNQSLFHMDLYRLEDNFDFYDIGGEELLKGNGILVIEWANRLELKLPEAPLEIELRYLDEFSREVCIHNPTSLMQEQFQKFLLEQKAS